MKYIIILFLLFTICFSLSAQYGPHDSSQLGIEFAINDIIDEIEKIKSILNLNAYHGNVIDDIKRQLSIVYGLEWDIIEIKNKLNSDETDNISWRIDDLDNSIKGSEYKISDIERNVETLGERLDDLEEQIYDLENRIDDLEYLRE